MAEKEIMQPTESIVELFHKVASLIPEGQVPISANPNMKIVEAISLMEKYDFSQLPVVSGKFVLGIFSYRSLTRNLIKLQPIGTDFRGLPVDEFMEPCSFVPPMNRWETILDILEQEDTVIVGNQDNMHAILTSTDVVNHLHHLAGAFIKLAEIETSLRRIISTCLNEEQLKQCIVNSLKEKYTPEESPDELSEMTLNDYVQIIGNGKNYIYFEQVFGPSDWQRKQTVARLNEVRELRNDTFHFKRQLNASDFAKLADHREWLVMKAMSFEGSQQTPSAETITKVTKKAKEKTNSTKFLAACTSVGADFFAWMLDEAEKRKFVINWGTVGFSVRTTYHKQLVSITYGYPPDLYQVYLDKKLELAEAEEEWREELRAFMLLEESGRYTLSSTITLETATRLREVFKYLLGKVTALTRYPLAIQVTYKGMLYHAAMLDAGGSVEFDGKVYNSVSAACIAATGRQTCNGWTFWHYHDTVSDEWHPIDDLRK